jgi:hypothetical protein
MYQKAPTEAPISRPWRPLWRPLKLAELAPILAPLGILSGHFWGGGALARVIFFPAQFQTQT